MKAKTMIVSGYSNPIVEKTLSNLDAHFSDRIPLEAKETGLRQETISQSEMRINVEQPVWDATQEAIYTIQNTLQVSSLMHTTRETEQQTKRINEIKRKDITDKLGQKAALKRKTDDITINEFKKKYSTWLTPTAITVGLADFTMAFYGYRQSSYPFMMALLSSLAIGAVIAFNHVFTVPLVKKAISVSAKITRVTSIMLVGAVLFLCIGNLRAGAVNQKVNLAIEGSAITDNNTSHINGWMIAGTSFILFAAVFFIALALWRTEEERLAEQEKERLEQEIRKLNKEIGQLNKEIEEREAETNQQKNTARQIHNYAVTAINRCKAIGERAIGVFKKQYLRYHNGQAPTFFSEQVVYVYDESFNITSPQKNEQL